MFKPGDNVTAGEAYGGVWQDLVVVSTDLDRVLARRRFDGVQGAFSRKELTLVQASPVGLPEVYVIVAENDADGFVGFLGSGDWYWEWYPSLSNAKTFTDISKAEKEVLKITAEQPRILLGEGGTKREFPATIIQSALNLNYKRPGPLKGRVYVARIDFCRLFKENISGEIKDVTDVVRERALAKLTAEERQVLGLN